MVKEFQELERVTNRQTSKSTEENFSANERPTAKPVNQKGLGFQDIEDGQKATPSKDRHQRLHTDKYLKNNKTFWSSGLENRANSPLTKEGIRTKTDKI